MEVDIYIESDAGLPRTERLDVEGLITIGRHSQCTLYLDGDRVSRTHVAVEMRPEGLSVEDRSSNGTVVGDRLIRREAVEVPYGTPMVIGGYTLLIRPAGMVMGAPMAAPPPPMLSPLPREPAPHQLTETNTAMPLAGGIPGLAPPRVPGFGPPPAPTATARPQAGPEEDATGESTRLELPPNFGPPPPPPLPRPPRPPPPLPPMAATSRPGALAPSQIHEAGTVKPSTPPHVPREKVILSDRKSVV